IPAPAIESFVAAGAPVLIESEPGLSFLVCRVSLREPVSAPAIMAERSLDGADKGQDPAAIASVGDGASRSRRARRRQLAPDRDGGRNQPSDAGVSFRL